MITVDKKYQIDSLSDLVLNASEGERMIVEINGHRVAIVPVEDAEYMEAQETARDFELARQRAAEITDLANRPTLEKLLELFVLPYK